MKFQLEGKLYEVKPTQQITDKFRKREFIIECANGMYQEHIKIDATQNACEKLDNAKIGNQIYVKCALKGRFYNKKDGTKGHMNTINAYEIDVVKGNPEFSLSEMENPF